MNYRYATPSDFPAIQQFVAGQQYFTPVEPYSLGGKWLIAEHGGKVYGTIWFFHQAPHAYLDFWAASNAKTAATLGAILEGAFKKNRIRYVRAMIYHDNKVALRMACTGFGMIGEGPYMQVSKRLQDGSNDHTSNDNTGTESAANCDTEPATTSRTS